MKNPHPLKKLNLSFRTRIFFLLALVILTVSSSFTIHYIRHENSSQTERLAMKGELLAQLLADNSRLALFAEQKKLLEKAADGMLQHEEVVSVTIFAADGGLLIHRSDPLKNHPAQEPAAITEALQEIISLLEKKKKPLHLIRPATIDCFAPVFASFGYSSPESLYFSDTPHQHKTHISGVTRIVLDKRNLDLHLHELLLSAVGIAAVFLTCALLAAFVVAQRVTRPLHQLMGGVKALQGGDLSARVVVKTEDELGEVSRAFNNMVETLEQREAENLELAAQLRHIQRMEAKDEWERTFDTVPEMIATLDTDHRVVRLNRAMAGRLQVTKEEAVGTCICEMLNTAGFSAPSSLLSALQDSAAGHSREISQQKGQSYFLVSVSPLCKSDGSFNGSVYVARDETSRKVATDLLQNSEERFRLIAGTIVEAFWLADMSTNTILYISPGYERIWGRSRDVLYENALSFFDAVHPDDRDRVLSTLEERTARLSYEHEYRIIRPDGSIRWIWDRGYPVAEGHEWGNCYTGVALDITDQKQATEEKKAIQAKLIQTNKMTSLGLMVSGLAHEVNNPNNMIKLAAHLLARSWQDILPILAQHYQQEGDFRIAGQEFSRAQELIPQHLATIRNNSLRIEGIIKNLRDFAKKGAANLSSKADVNIIVSLAAAILDSQIRLHTRRFQMELHEGLPPIRGNPQQLEQVVINLVMNAMQALPDRDRKVSITTGVTPDNNWVVLTVEDEGAGMPPQVREHAGEPFFSTRLDKGGTGLGLAISNFIIQEHQGMLEIETNPGEGTTIRVKLPVLSDHPLDSIKGALHVTA